MASHQQLNICHRGWFPTFIFFSILQTCVKFQVIYPGCTDYIPEVKIVIAQSSRSIETATCTIHLKSLVTLPGLHLLNIVFLIRLFPYRLPTSNTYNPLQLKLSWFIRLVPVVRVIMFTDRLCSPGYFLGGEGADFNLTCSHVESNPFFTWAKMLVTK